VCCLASSSGTPPFPYIPSPTCPPLAQINGKIYFVAQQEAPNPSNTYLWEVTQDAATGKLTNVPGSLRAVNTKSVGGTVYLCSGDDTPWCVCQTAAGALVAFMWRAVYVAPACSCWRSLAIYC
jgi:hypothetical protein